MRTMNKLRKSVETNDAADFDRTKFNHGEPKLGNPDCSMKYSPKLIERMRGVLPHWAYLKNNPGKVKKLSDIPIDFGAQITEKAKRNNSFKAY